MNRKTDSQLSRLSDEVHLVTMPARIAAEWIRMLIFIAVLPIVFLASVVDWLVTGTPIMSADEIWLTKVVLTVLSPWITTFLYLFWKHWRAARGHPIESPIPSALIFFGTIAIVLVLVKCNFYFGWGFYD